MKYQQKNGQFALKPKQVEQLIRGAKTYRDKVIIELLYYCALRRAEVCSLRTADIDFSENQMSVVGKGNKRRLVPLAGPVGADLKLYLSGARRMWVFPAKRAKRRPLHPLAVNYILKAASVRAQVANPNPRFRWINPHLLRHSAARRLKAAGMPLEGIKEFLGHENIKTTAEHYGLMDVSEVMERVSEVLS